MSGPKRSTMQREKDLQTAAALYLQGKTQTEIAAALGVCQQQVSYDLEIVRQRWLESSVLDFNTKKAEELARIDNLERVAWESWERSQTIYGKDGKPLKRKSPGDPRFLKQVEACIEKRVKILGLNAPEVTETNLHVGRPLLELSDDELLATGLRPPGANHDLEA